MGGQHDINNGNGSTFIVLKNNPGKMKTVMLNWNPYFSVIVLNIVKLHSSILAAFVGCLRILI